MTFKPNLAGTPKSDADIRFPVLASPKIDGVRAMIHPGGLMSRSMKFIPNKFVQIELGLSQLIGLDGELVVGLATDPNCMQNTTSGVMSYDKKPDFTFYVFDKFDSPHQFESRLVQATTQVLKATRDWPALRIAMVRHTVINTLDDLNVYEAEQLALGYEGVMIRSLTGLYKQGRSTPKEGGLLKIKRFEDNEFLIVGFEEQMENTNPKQINELGRTKRSSHAAGKIGKGTLGAFKARHITGWDGHGEAMLGAAFNVGTGMDDKFRAWAWANQDKLLSAIGTYKSFPIGVLDAPRHPVFKSLREKWDIS